MAAMTRPIDIGLIQARRRRIAEALEQERVRHEKAITGLQDELDELVIAERVFTKLSSEGTATPAPASADRQESHAGKPEGLPAVSDMIIEALVHALSMGSPGLMPAGLLSYIRGKWWSEARSNDVGPIAWRMWQNDALDKLNSGEYALVAAQREQVLSRLRKEASKSPGPIQPETS